jgi:hypothetical protein
MDLFPSTSSFSRIAALLVRLIVRMAVCFSESLMPPKSSAVLWS